MSIPTLRITRHEGKLEGIPSINTSPLDNDFCEKMSAIKGSVCAKCYARRFVRIRKALHACCVSNGDLLRDYLPDAAIPRFNERYVRFHSFGELINHAHLANFTRIAARNPDTVFALWTKRVGLLRHRWRGATRSFDIPGNVVLNWSASMLDDPRRHVPRGFDNSFVVTTTAEPCGERCLDCLKCWTKGGGHVVLQRVH